MHSRFSEKWLETLCGTLPNVHSAVFMVPKDKDELHLLARWPRTLDRYQDFFAVVKYALKKRGEVCLAKAHVHEGKALDYFAKPVFIRSRLVGVLALKLDHLPTKKHLAVFHALKLAVRWLGLAGYDQSAAENFYNHVVGLLASCFEQGSYQQGLMRLVAELTSQFDCERVAFAECQGRHCEVRALSNSAGFDHRSNLVRKLGDAMDEAIEQDAAILYPDGDGRLILRAHRELARKYGSGSIATIPLIDRRRVFGAVTLLASEDNPLDRETLDLCQQSFALLAPYLALQRDQERNIFAKLFASARDALGALFGPRYLQAKLLTLVVASMLLFVSIGHGQFRVTADAVLEGEVQRVVAAPISGYLLSSSVRAGDFIERGQVMATLDDAELELEMARLHGRLQQARREYREAQSARDLVKVRVIRAQIDQIDAEIALVRQQLGSLQLAAPFDGVVIEGDLSQRLGSPVERGDALFTIAPLEGYRIILKVDERLISHVRAGQPGMLTLTSLSRQNFPLLVKRITSVASADDGANIFRVEASLPRAPDLLRPGMEGIGKIYAGEKRLIWIWTHEIVDWLRLWVWSWWP